MEGKYRDREFLSDYDLDFEVFKKFGIEIIDVIPVRKVYIALSEDRAYVLKKVDYKSEDIYFIKYIIDSLKKNGFYDVFDYVKAQDGTLYVEHNESVYIMMEYVEGRECQCFNPLDIQMASRAIARLHSHGKNIKITTEERNNIGKLINRLKDKQKCIEDIKIMVEGFKIRRKFDEIFMENVESALEQMKESISELEKGAYFKLCKDEDAITICHHDLAHHNILIHEEKAYFVDFDYVIKDLKIHDLCNFINKVMKEHYYDINIAEDILNEYVVIETLSIDEISCLYSLLKFPEDFYSISAGYYNRLKNWDEETFIKRFEKKADFREDRENFLWKFKEKFIESRK